MKISDTVLKRVEKLDDPDVRELLKFYEFVVNNQVYESYIARVITLDKFNQSLIENPVSIISVKQLAVTDDGVNEKEELRLDKEVDRVLKFLEKQPILLTGTEAIRARLTSDELEATNMDKRLDANSEDRAFKVRKNDRD